MAKTRAQRKAEKRRKEERREQRAEQRAADPGDEAQAQHDTQIPVSGEVAEAEAVIESGARTEDYGEHTIEQEPPPALGAQAAVPGVTPAPIVPEPLAPEPGGIDEAPAPSRADVGRPDEAAEPPPDESRDERRARREREKEDRRRARAKQLQKGESGEPAVAKRRGRVTGFIASSWAELKRVQWPDRDTLIQASAVTLIFVMVMAAYLGALDGIFNWLVKQII
jgi:preprotein translocase SecE subunit